MYLNYIVILDNGHGKETPGKRSPIWKDKSQLFEWEYTRKVVKALERKLSGHGIATYIVVPEETDVTLSERAARANKVIAGTKRPCIFVSIHNNAANGNAQGWEVWTTTKKNNSDELAKYFVDEFPKVFPDRKNRGHKEKDFTVIYKTNCPAVLTENFFMDNEDDCKYLLSAEGFNKVVDLHLHAILNYIKDQKLKLGAK